MNLLLRAARIIAPQSSYHLQQQDLLIEKGLITRIGKQLSAPRGTKVIDSDHLCISPGWIDMAAFLGDPGYEYKEDLSSGARAAAAGGFTAVCCLPNTRPALHTKSEIEYIINKSASLPVNILPIGALTNDCRGVDIAEIYDMHHAGAVAFSDGTGAPTPAGTMLRALLYVKPFKGLIISFPHEPSLATDGLMNESPVSSRLGLKGIPNLCEEIAVIRDIKLCEYAQSKLHFAYVSTRESLTHISHAKKKGLAVSCAVAAYNLILTDEDMESYDSNLKVSPPLRSLHDRKALIEGLKKNIIDTVVSMHQPHDPESKNIEFDQAAFGIIGLETSFAIVNTIMRSYVSLEKIVEKFSINPRKILGIKIPEIKEGVMADLTIFDSNKNWQYMKSFSKSVNSPFFNREFVGKPLGIVNKGIIFINEQD